MHLMEFMEINHILKSLNHDLWKIIIQKSLIVKLMNYMFIIDILFYNPLSAKKYNGSTKKILFVGESHYLPAKYNDTVSTEWYKKSLSDYNFSERDESYLNTRNIINGVINKRGI